MVPPFSADPEIERDQLTHFRSLLQYSYEKIRRSSKVQIQRAEEMNSMERSLTARMAKEAARTAELDAKQAELDTRSAELDGTRAKLDARTAELSARAVEMDARQDALHQFDSDLKRLEGVLDKREALIDQRRQDVLRALAVESDNNLARLEARKAEIDAIAAENDVKIKQIADKLDRRDAELKKFAADLDERAAELERANAAQAQHGRKRARDVDFSLVTQMAQELKKINDMELDVSTKEELKKSLYFMLERAHE